MNITVTKVDDSTFEVEVRGRTTTTHRATTAPEYVAGLTGGKLSAAELVERSFEFLLERESRPSIPGRFDLPRKW